MRVQAAIGPTRKDQGTEYDANAIVRLIAPVLRATPGEMLNEAFVTHELWDHVRRRPAVADALRSIHQGHILLTTVGAEPHDEMQAVRGKIVANLCTLMLDEDGREVRTKQVGVGPTYSGIREMAQDPSRHVVVATGGSVSSMIPLRAALRGALVSDLVTDVVTAAWLAGEILYPATA
jgi:DNA-binding transcriptional regulator LsrR (DeoR family)